MDSIYKTPGFILHGLMIAIVFVSTTACAGTIRVPDETLAVLFVDKNGEITALAHDGSQLNKCRLPSLEEAKRLSKTAPEDFEKVLEEMKQNEIAPCKSLIKSTPYQTKTTTNQFGQSVDIIFNYQNPCTITMIINNQPTEVPVPDRYCK